MKPTDSKSGAATGRVDPPQAAVPTVEPRRPGLNRWLARLSASFAIVAAVLAWQGYLALAGGAAIWRPAVDLFAAAAAVALAAAGARAAPPPVLSRPMS